MGSWNGNRSKNRPGKCLQKSHSTRGSFNSLCSFPQLIAEISDAVVPYMETQCHRDEVRVIKAFHKPTFAVLCSTSLTFDFLYKGVDVSYGISLLIWGRSEDLWVNEGDEVLVVSMFLTSPHSKTLLKQLETSEGTLINENKALKSAEINALCHFVSETFL